MRPRRPRQLPMPFDREADVLLDGMPADRAQAVVAALADLLLAAMRGDDPSEEPADAREDHR